MRVKREEYEKLQKRIKELEDIVDTRIEDLECEVDTLRDEIRSNHVPEEKIAQIVNEAISDHLEDKFFDKSEEIEAELPKMIASVIKDAKLEDAVLLKVVKAAFGFKENDK